MMKRFLLSALICLCAIAAKAQVHKIYDDRIRSLQVVANDDWQHLPVISLRDGKIDIDFDDLTHQYERYTYKIEHCEYDWSVSSELFSSDFLNGFANGSTIDDVMESINTNTLYTHYHLTLPNDKCSFKMSGNYRITVFRENDENTPVLEACFMIAEQKVGIRMESTSNTDIENNGRYQQLSMQVNYNGLRVDNPQTQLKTVVMQNRQWHDARVNVKPQFTMADGLQWRHCRDYIFMAGNVYHKFEMLSTDNPSMGVERLDWDGTSYNAYPYVDSPRRNYVYDESAQGAFVLRNSDNVENTTTSDYMNVHFELKCDEPAQGDIYLNGDWTYDTFSNAYKMTYDNATRSYKATVPLKLGYYSYQYLLKDFAGKILYPPFEGSFYETKNTYQTLVYYRANGDRTDRLVGYATLE